MNVAVFGGSFDPPHLGHEEIIKKTLQELDIEVLFIVPTFLNPFKESFFAPSWKRYKWVEKLLKNYPKTEIVDYEIRQNRPVPTIETIKYLLENYELDKIYLIIGADNVDTLHKWKNYNELKKLVHFVVASRDEIKTCKNLQKLDIHVNISSTELRDNIKKEYLPKMISDEIIKYYKKRGKMNDQIERIINILDEKKAENIQLFDMREKDYVVEDVIIATTLGPKHGLALLEYVKDEIKPDNKSYFNIEPSDEWTIIDMGDIMIHLMTPEYRARYNIEEFLSERIKQNSNEI